MVMAPGDPLVNLTVGGLSFNFTFVNTSVTILNSIQIKLQTLNIMNVTVFISTLADYNVTYAEFSIDDFTIGVTPPYAQSLITRYHN